jgi:hypothetical protein
MNVSRFALLGVLSLLPACSSKSVAQATGSPSDAAMPAGKPCVTQGPACLKNQQICVADGAKESCLACPDGQYAKDPNTCAKIPGTLVRHVFDKYALGPGQEIDGLCQSWTLNNDAEIWVSGVELKTNGGYHHSNWLFAPDTEYPGPDGEWMCDTRGYSELKTAVAGGVIFAQSTQARHQVQQLQDGAAVKLPPHARIIGGTHLLNTGTDPIDTTLDFSLYEVDVKDVKVPLAPFRLTYADLTIQPKAISEFTGTCDFAASVPNGNPSDLDMDLYYVMPHYHVLGHSFHLETYGGPNDGKAIYDIGAFDGEAHGLPLVPPVSMRGAKGFRFTCGFENPRDKEVRWGIGDQEMCVMLAFARSDYVFDATVGSGAATGQKKDGTFQYSGACNLLALEFARGKGSLGPDAGK